MNLKDELIGLKQIGIKFEDPSFNSEWIRVYIQNDDGNQIGRISYKVDSQNEIQERFLKYYKPEDYGFTVQDIIFFKINFFIKTGCELNKEKFIEFIRKIQNTLYSERVEYCKNNPKFKKNKGKLKQIRRKCFRRNLRKIGDSIISSKYYDRWLVDLNAFLFK